LALFLKIQGNAMWLHEHEAVMLRSWEGGMGLRDGVS
jgi:hypothetical protein